ncbi:MAG: Hsp70 family protein [Solirubrobacteraceae bacterium]
MSIVYGIDLGTTYSCIARISDFDETLGEVLRNTDNEAVTPSVVFFDVGDVVVGKQAKNKARLKPEQTARLFKREMGSDDPVFEAQGKEWHPQELSALVLSKLVQDVREATGEEVKDVVITCPAYFGFKERAATKLAGEIAELNVLGIINEPTAAAYHYGFRLDSAGPAQTLLVYDLGGGTFDVSVVRRAADEIATIATHGSKELGGADWDNALLDYAAEQFMAQQEGAPDPRDDPQDLQELLTQVEQAKQALTDRESTEIFVMSGARRDEVVVDRATFDQITASLLNQTIDYTRQAIADAEAKGHSVDTVILVGGSSKMRQVAARLERELGQVPALREPDLAVAKGAALAANQIARLENAGSDPTSPRPDADNGSSNGHDHSLPPAPAGISDICPWSFGILVTDSRRQKPIIAYMIRRGDKIPNDVTEVFYTEVDDQRSIASGIYQQKPGAEESEEPDENEEVASYVIEGIPAGFPAGTPLQTTFGMDLSGLIVVSTQHPGMSQPERVEVRVELKGPSLEESKKKISAGLVRA